MFLDWKRVEFSKNIIGKVPRDMAKFLKKEDVKSFTFILFEEVLLRQQVLNKWWTSSAGKILLCPSSIYLQVSLPLKLSPASRKQRVQFYYSSYSSYPAWFFYVSSYSSYPTWFFYYSSYSSYPAWFLYYSSYSSYPALFFYVSSYS